MTSLVIKKCLWAHSSFNKHLYGYEPSETACSEPEEPEDLKKTLRFGGIRRADASALCDRIDLTVGCYAQRGSYGVSDEK